MTENDEWLVFQCESAGVVIAYRLLDGTIRTKAWPGLNQPQAVRHAGDNYVILCSNTYRKTGVWNYRLNTFFEHTHLYSGHPAPVRGGMAEFDPSFDDGVDCFTYDAATNTRKQRATPNAVNAYTGMHKVSQWINGTTSDDEWFQDTSEARSHSVSSFNPDHGSVYRGECSLTVYGVKQSGKPLQRAASYAAIAEGTWYADVAERAVWVWAAGGGDPTGTCVVDQWVLDSGTVFKTLVNYKYGFNTVGTAWVAQGPAGRGEPLSWTATLAPVPTRAAMIEGSWFHDLKSNTLYVWAIGGVAPGDVLSVFAAHGSSLGISWHTGDARDARLICHSRCFINAYSSNVFGTMSPDGLAVMFSSNMGVKAGRVDAYLALIPET